MAGQGKGPKSQTCVSCLWGQVHLFWNRDIAIGYVKDEQVVISPKQIFFSFKTASSPQISTLVIPGYPLQDNSQVELPFSIRTTGLMWCVWLWSG